MEKLNLSSVLNKGKYNGKTVDEIISANRNELTTLLKKGYEFEDEVFEKARYKRIIRNKKTVFEFVDRPKINKEVKVYKKDTESLNKILEEITNNNIDYKDEEDNSICW